MADDNSLNAHVAKIWSSWLGRVVTGDEVALLLTMYSLGKREFEEQQEKLRPKDTSGPVIQGC